MGKLQAYAKQYLVFIQNTRSMKANKNKNANKSIKSILI